MARGYDFNSDSDKPFVCKKCGKGFKSEGGYNLHGPCGPGYRKGNNQKGRQQGGGENGCVCGGRKRLLSESVTLEGHAIKAGYIAVCGSCGELY